MEIIIWRQYLVFVKAELWTFVFKYQNFVDSLTQLVGQNNNFGSCFGFWKIDFMFVQKTASE